jgi:hypothetical protein
MATWKEHADIKQHFPFPPVWVQAGTQGRENVSVPVISNQDAEEGKDTSARKEKDVKLEAGLDGLRRSKRAIRPEP